LGVLKLRGGVVGRVGVGKIWVALAALAAEALLLGWLVGRQVWKLASKAVGGW
jgi:hypothetical protein